MSRTTIVLCFGLLLFVAHSSQSHPLTYTISTIAGTGERGFRGEGKQAKAALLNGCTGVAVDKEGTVYIADNNNHCVHVVRNGIIKRFAGTGIPGFSGDGGPAMEAQLRDPYGVYVDPEGNVLIADSRNNRIRRVSKAGIITTVAGSGEAGFSGDGGHALESRLSHPDDMLIDGSGNLIIADAGNDKIRRVDKFGIITTIAGSGITSYNGDGGYSGDGMHATRAQLNTPAALVIDNLGSLYVADLRNHAVRKISTDGKISTVAGTGERGYNGDEIFAISAKLSEPGGVAILPDGSLVIADGGNNRVRLVTRDGLIHTIAGTGLRGDSGDEGPALDADLSIMDLVAVDQAGVIYVTDYGNNKIRKLVPGEAKRPKVNALLSQMRSAYATLRQADIEFEYTRVGQAVPIEGTVKSSSNNELEVTLKIEGYGRVKIHSDGYKITVADPKRSKPEYQRFEPRWMNVFVPANLEIICLYDWQRQLVSTKGGNMFGSELEVLDGSWQDRRWKILVEKAGGRHISYYVHPNTFLIWRTLIKNETDKSVIYDGRITRFDYEDGRAKD